MAWSLRTVVPGLDQFFGEVAACLHEERARTHRHIADLEIEDLGGRAQLPLLFGQTLGGTDVDQGIEGVLHNRLGQAARRVVRACRATVRAACDIDRAGRHDHEIAKGIATQEPGERIDAVKDVLAVVTGFHQTAHAPRVW